MGLSGLPQNMDDDAPFTDPPQCMPDYCKGEDTVLAYQNYYILEKSGFASGLKEKRQYFCGEI